MKTGIFVPGLNGCGKTTAGKPLSEMTGLMRIDAEDYRFAPSDVPFSAPRTKSEAAELIAADIEASSGFVMSSVTCDRPESVTRHITFAAVVTVPEEARRERLIARSRLRFGERVLPGGDMYRPEADFTEKCMKRTENMVFDSPKGLMCPVTVFA